MRTIDQGESQVFRKEMSVLTRAREIVAANLPEPQQLMEEYRQLSQRYGELLNMAAKLTNLGDRNQRKLIRLKNELHLRNDQIEKQKEALEILNKKLEEASLTDALTGLRNRRYLIHSLADTVPRLLRRFRDSCDDARGLLFMMVDIDRFKLVNDTYGHSAGDEVLKQFAARIRESFRESDLSVRMGGEEFLTVVSDASFDMGPGLAEKLRHAVENEPFDLGQGERLSCTCSIGFACFPFVAAAPDRFSWEHSAHIADMGLYAAKKSQRNAWVGLSPKDAASGAELSHDLLEDLEPAYDRGLLHVAASLPEHAPIVWR